VLFSLLFRRFVTGLGELGKNNDVTPLIGRGRHVQQQRAVVVEEQLDGVGVIGAGIFNQLDFGQVTFGQKGFPLDIVGVILPRHQHLAHARSVRTVVLQIEADGGLLLAAQLFRRVAGAAAGQKNPGQRQIDVEPTQPILHIAPVNKRKLQAM
jgi:hypothetical protein